MITEIHYNFTKNVKNLNASFFLRTSTHEKDSPEFEDGITDIVFFSNYFYNHVIMDLLKFKANLLYFYWLGM